MVYSFSDENYFKDFEEIKNFIIDLSKTNFKFKPNPYKFNSISSLINK